MPDVIVPLDCPRGPGQRHEFLFLGRKEVRNNDAALWERIIMEPQYTCKWCLWEVKQRSVLVADKAQGPYAKTRINYTKKEGKK